MKSDMEWAEMVELNRQGVSIGDIANKMGVDRKTARKYIQAGSPPRTPGRRARPIDDPSSAS